MSRPLDVTVTGQVAKPGVLEYKDGLTVKSATPIVASMDHYDPYFPGAFSTLGTPLGTSAAIS